MESDGLLGSKDKIETELAWSKPGNTNENGNIDKDLQAQLEVLLFARAKIIKKAKSINNNNTKRIKRLIKEEELVV